MKKLGLGLAGILLSGCSVAPESVRPFSSLYPGREDDRFQIALYEEARKESREGIDFFIELSQTQEIYEQTQREMAEFFQSLAKFDSLINTGNKDTEHNDGSYKITFFPEVEPSDEIRIPRKIVLDVAEFFGLDASKEQEYARAELYAEKQKDAYMIASVFDSLRNVHSSLRNRSYDLGSFLFVVSDGTYVTSKLSERIDAVQEVHSAIDPDYKGLDDKYFDIEQNIRLLDKPKSDF